MRRPRETEVVIEFEDPRAEPGAPVEPYALSLDPSEATIGLLANGFPDSEEFLDRVEKTLAAALPNARFERYNKRNASSILSDSMLDEIAADCDAVIGAYGH